VTRFARHAAVWALAPVVAAACAGCCRPPKTTVSLARLVAEYNANAAAVPRLWARARIQVDLLHDGLPISWGSTGPLAEPNGLLLLGKGPDRLGPHDFVLIGRETLAVELFRLGSNVEQGRYYFWARFGQGGGAWWGRNELAGAPGVTGLPIDPNQLPAVLGVCELPDDLTRLPTVLLRMRTEPCKYAYVLSYVDRRPISRRIGVRREVYFVWDDAKPRRPFLVRFLDARGRAILEARLADYRPIDVSALANPPATPPVMPTDIRITWTGKAARSLVRRIHLVLSEMTAEDTWDREATRFEPTGVSPGRVVQVDAGLKKGGGPK